MAFFPGELVHTNVVLVTQGQHLVEVSTTHAAAMLGRRAAYAGACLLPAGGSMVVGMQSGCLACHVKAAGMSC